MKCDVCSKVDKSSGYITHHGIGTICDNCLDIAGVQAIKKAKEGRRNYIPSPEFPCPTCGTLVLIKKGNIQNLNINKELSKDEDS